MHRRSLILLLGLLAALGLGAGDPLGAARKPLGHRADPPQIRFSDVSATHVPPMSPAGRSMEARAGDVDGDGDPDLLIAKEWAANVLLLNDGAGRFANAAAQLPQAIHDSEDIALADFDGDGDLDAIVASEDDQISEYYLNDGRGRFSDAVQGLPAAARSNAVAAGDLDRDGDLDAVMGNNGQDRIFINDGTGVFTDETALRLPVSADITQDAALGDADGDGDPDLLLGNEDGNKLLLNDGAGVFSAGAALPPPDAPEETRNADFGDIDGDGDLDIFFANVAWVPGAQPQDRLLLNDGTGVFTDATALRLPRDSSFTLDGDFADLDRDGDLDLIAAYIPRQPVRAFLNDGAGAFADQTAALFPPDLQSEAIELETADFNGDGWLDIYVASFSGGDRLLLAQPPTRVALPLVGVGE